VESPEKNHNSGIKIVTRDTFIELQPSKDPFKKAEEKRPKSILTKGVIKSTSTAVASKFPQALNNDEPIVEFDSILEDNDNDEPFDVVMGDGQMIGVGIINQKPLKPMKKANSEMPEFVAKKTIRKASLRSSRHSTETKHEGLVNMMVHATNMDNLNNNFNHRNSLNSIVNAFVINKEDQLQRSSSIIGSEEKRISSSTEYKKRTPIHTSVLEKHPESKAHHSSFIKQMGFGGAGINYEKLDVDKEPQTVEKYNKLEFESNMPSNAKTVEMQEIELKDRTQNHPDLENPQEPVIKSEPNLRESTGRLNPEGDSKPEFVKKVGSHLPPDFDPKFIRMCVYVQFFANLFINIDMGILPAGSTKIKEELLIDNYKFGLLGSMVYLGQTLGSALATGYL
jgi:hypothetical protein